MRSLFKWILIIIIYFIFLYGFTASYNSQNIDHLDYVVAISVDDIPDNNNLEVSFEFANSRSYSDNASSEDNEPILDTVSSPSISGAINIMNAYIGKQLNLSHCKVVAFSDKIAKKGILSEVAFLMNDTQIRPTTNVIIAKDNAKEYLKSSTSSLEHILTKYYDVFPTSSEYTGYTSNILLSDFYEGLINEHSGSVTILGMKSKKSNESNQSESEQSASGQSSSIGTMDSSSKNAQSSSSEQIDSTNSTFDNNSIDTVPPGESIVSGDRGTENIGLCVFKDDVYIGDLSPIDTLCYTIIKNEVDNFMVTIDNPFEESKKIDLSVSKPYPCTFNLDISNENPTIDLKLGLTSIALNGQDTLDFSNSETLNRLNDSFNEYMSSQMRNYLYKISRDYKCDINYFYKTAKKKFSTISDFENYNWKEKFQNAEFNVNIDSNITSSLLIQKTS